MQATRTRPGPIPFLLLLTGFSLPFYLLGFIAGELPFLPDLPASALMFCCPLLVTVVLVGRRDGARAVRRRLAGLFAPGSRPGLWWPSAAGVFVAVAAVAILGLWTVGVRTEAAGTGWSSVPALIVVFGIAAFGEEAGWMGYLARVLPGRWTWPVSGLVIGGIWAVWHLVPLVQAGHGPWWMVGWTASTVAGRVLITWLYARSGTAGTAIVAHATMTRVSALLPGDSTAPAMLAVGAATVGAAAVVVWLESLNGTGSRDGQRVAASTFPMIR